MLSQCFGETNEHLVSKLGDAISTAFQKKQTVPQKMTPRLALGWFGSLGSFVFTQSRVRAPANASDHVR